MRERESVEGGSKGSAPLPPPSPTQQTVNGAYAGGKRGMPPGGRACVSVCGWGGWGWGRTSGRTHGSMQYEPPPAVRSRPKSSWTARKVTDQDSRTPISATTSSLSFPTKISKFAGRRGGVTMRTKNERMSSTAEASSRAPTLTWPLAPDTRPSKNVFKTLRRFSASKCAWDGVGWGVTRVGHSAGWGRLKGRRGWRGSH